jgi:uncharacterized protein YeaO (DUF488 family)
MHEFASEREPADEPDVRIKRIYDKRDRADGFRVLVDRVWPRGVRKRNAALDEWLPDLAPSPALRKWFGHDPERWPEFRKRYRAELRGRAAKLDALRQRAGSQCVTLLYAARDRRFNHAVVLEEAMRGPTARR